QVENKKNAMRVVSTVQVQLSRYILTVSAINLALGLAVGSALWLLGVEDALLWGVMVGLLNYAPYIGTLIGVGILVLAGLVQFGLTLLALMPPLVYLA